MRITITAPRWLHFRRHGLKPASNWLEAMGRRVAGEQQRGEEAQESQHVGCEVTRCNA